MCMNQAGSINICMMDRLDADVDVGKDGTFVLLGAGEREELFPLDYSNNRGAGQAKKGPGVFSFSVVYCCPFFFSFPVIV